jgi:peptidyl-prolyl cis-trans isomerase B (cyclophilin B)
MRRWIVSFFLLMSTVVLTSCTNGLGISSDSSPSPKSSVETSATPTSIEATNIKAPKEIKKTPLADAGVKSPQLTGSATVEMKLKQGTVTIAVDGEHAPITAGNFIDLVNRGFYTNLTFHRVEKDPSPFVVQGGDPEGNGTGGFNDPATSQPRNIPLEILPEGEKTPIYGKVLGSTAKPQLKHTKGAVAMARSQSPNSASSQFYITLADAKFLDGSYAVFGYVTSGMDVVDKIQVGDRIESIKIIEGKDNLKQSASAEIAPAKNN